MGDNSGGLLVRGGGGWLVLKREPEIRTAPAGRDQQQGRLKSGFGIRETDLLPLRWLGELPGMSRGGIQALGNLAPWAGAKTAKRGER